MVGFLEIIRLLEIFHIKIFRFDYCQTLEYS